MPLSNDSGGHHCRCGICYEIRILRRVTLRRMSTETPPTVIIKLHCSQFPGMYFSEASGSGLKPDAIYVGLQRGEEVIDLVRGDAESATFTASFHVTKQKDGSPNFLGPFAKGTPRERFFYLSWGVQGPLGSFRSFRRAKIPLSSLSWEKVDAAIQNGTPIRADVTLTDAKGGPVCATLKSTHLRWRE